MQSPRGRIKFSLRKQNLSQCVDRFSQEDGLPEPQPVLENRRGCPLSRCHTEALLMAFGVLKMVLLEKARDF